MMLLTDQTGNTNGSQEVLECSGGTILIQAAGTFDGCSVTLEGSINGLTYDTLSDNTGEDVTIIEPGFYIIEFCKSGLNIRAALAGAGDDTDVSIGALQ